MRSFGTKILLSLFAIIGWVLVVGVIDIIFGGNGSIVGFLTMLSMVGMVYVIVGIFRGAAVPASGDSEASTGFPYVRLALGGFAVWFVYLMITLDPAEVEAKNGKPNAAPVVKLSAKEAERKKVGYEFKGAEGPHHFIFVDADPVGKVEAKAKRYFQIASYVCDEDRSAESRRLGICSVLIWNDWNKTPASLPMSDNAKKSMVASYRINWVEGLELLYVGKESFKIPQGWRK